MITRRAFTQLVSAFLGSVVTHTQSDGVALRSISHPEIDEFNRVPFDNNFPIGTISDMVPADPQIGQLWYCTEQDATCLMQYRESGWQLVQSYTSLELPWDVGLDELKITEAHIEIKPTSAHLRVSGVDPEFSREGYKNKHGRSCSSVGYANATQLYPCRDENGDMVLS